jgi:tight adherence protein C
MIGWALLAAVATFVVTVAAGLSARPQARTGGRSLAMEPEGSQPWTDAADRGGLARLLTVGYQRDLTAAGIVANDRQLAFLAVHAAMTAGCAFLASWIAAANFTAPSSLLLAGAVGAIVGWWLPRSWLEWKRSQRRLEIVTDFPVMLDLLQISMQGGMGLSAAWTAVAGSLEGAGDALAEEMRRIDLEVGFGEGWSQALSAASDRTGVSEFRSLGSLLGQTDRYGTEVTQMIQVLSDSLRHEELQGLEERAHQASVKMLFPLAAMLLPATLMLTIGPLLLLLFDALQRADAL